MQNWIDLIVSNAAFFVAFFVFVVFVVGFVIAMFSEAGRAALGRAAVGSRLRRWPSPNVGYAARSTANRAVRTRDT